MEAKKCDRCGKLYEYTHVENEKENYEGSDSVILRRCEIDGYERNAKEWDLCPECLAEFLLYIAAGSVRKCAPAAEVLPVNAGEYWKHNKTGEIVKVMDVQKDILKFDSVVNSEKYIYGVKEFLECFTKKGGAE